jgi:hypothetical protein
MSLQIFQLFKMLNPPLFSYPFEKMGDRGILIVLFYLQKFYIKTYEIKGKEK